MYMHVYICIHVCNANTLYAMKTLCMQCKHFILHTHALTHIHIKSTIPKKYFQLIIFILSYPNKQHTIK